MKRVLLICVISLLFVSGWGHVLGAAFCTKMQEMPGCHMQAGNSSTHGHGHMEMSGAQGKANSLERPLASCCASRPEAPGVPAVVSRGAEQSKQDAVALPKPTPKTIAPPARSFAPPVTSRQHAPPGAQPPRHVLVNVFLI